MSVFLCGQHHRVTWNMININREVLPITPHKFVVRFKINNKFSSLFVFPHADSLICSRIGLEDSLIYKQ